MQVTHQKSKTFFHWSVSSLFCLGLGLFLWTLYSTDISLRGTIPDVIFPLIVGIVGIASLAKIKHASSKLAKCMILLFSLPSLIGASLYVFFGLILLIPPFTLGAIFHVSELAGEKSLQQVTSPNGRWVAEVRFRGVGAYDAGNGHTYVFIRHALLPLLEQEIYYVDASFATSYTTKYVTWTNDNTLFISETQEEVSVGNLSWHQPSVIRIPMIIIGLLNELGPLSERRAMESELSAPVDDIPVFNGAISHDQSQYDERNETAFRSFNVAKNNTADLATWYEQALSNPPWSLNRIDHYVTQESGKKRVRYCLQAQRRVDNDSNVYYWELMGTEDRADGVHVNIGTPNPVTDTCRRYLDK